MEDNRVHTDLWRNTVSLTRKRKKEIARLKGDANALWSAQQEVLEHANYLAREAGRQVGNYGREQVVPTVVDTYEHRVAPVLDRGVAITRDVASATRHGIDTRVVPAIGSAVGTVMAIGDVANDARVRAAIKRANPKATVAAIKKAAAPAPKKRSVGGILAIGAGILAVAGVGYALWQTFRADDELWVSEDEPLLPNA